MSDRDHRAGPGRLVLVATPIGNLEDLSPRAVRLLAEAHVVAAEDTRRTGRLLAAAGVDARLVAVHEHNERQRSDELLDRVARDETVVLVTDAGTPSVSDPGFVLVREAHARGLRVEAVPGPSAVLHALVVSGLPTDRFAFEGFLPRRAGARRRRLAEVVADPRTLVFYVAPHRAGEDLRAMAEAFGDRSAALARELSKLHEEVWRASLPELAQRVARDGVRGEVTLVVAGAAPHVGRPSDAELAAQVRGRIAAGEDRREALRAVAREHEVPRREVYQAVLDAG